ncbi:unnamed protein product [Acanthoscelides obtectus]|uniref:Uncharacterized protein n=1 Tax=Acanthoscelides obtectus TaxID=200917 RepID=A0A9P0KXT8_ACAOB|nr:unnamed protein product [Acanthoscelides obtectus]CAK1649517.1 hypothetical protein AOBTE_LOCUS16290 [Acanthoscelides obtectus]
MCREIYFKVVKLHRNIFGVFRYVFRLRPVPTAAQRALLLSTLMRLIWTRLQNWSMTNYFIGSTHFQCKTGYEV